MSPLTITIDPKSAAADANLAATGRPVDRRSVLAFGEISVDDIVAGTGLVLPEEPSNQPFDGQS